jgi:hypothetical protein
MLDRVYGEILEMHHHREIWQFFNEELPKHGNPGTVHTALARWYVDSQAAAIRRLHDPNANISLSSLLLSIRAHATTVTRQQYLLLWPQLRAPEGDPHGTFARMANDTFDNFAPNGGPHVDVDVVNDDLAELREAARGVSRWADENVAHLGRVSTVQVTFEELDQAVNTLGELLTKYYNLLTAKALMNVTPTIQDNWTSPFREAWL